MEKLQGYAAQRNISRNLIYYICVHEKNTENQVIQPKNAHV